MRRIVSWLTEASFRTAWVVVLATVLLLGFGAVTLTHVKEELIPDISFPVLTVIAQSPGGQPADITQQVTTPIESAVSALPGLKKTQSTTIAGLSVIVLNFNYGTNLTKSETAVKEALGGARLAPAVTTSVLKFDVSLLPVVQLTLQGDKSPAELYAIAQTQILPQLTKLDGVGSASVVGGAVNEVVVTLDRQKLLDSGLSYDQVANALKANNVILPSGRLQTGTTSVPLETVAVYTSIDQIKQIPLRAPGSTSTVKLGDIAQIAEAQAAAVGANRTNGQSAVGISVTKTKDANTVAVAHAVTKELKQIEPALPAGVSTTIFEDQSTFITKSVNGVVQDGIVGGVLAIVIVFLFLANWRTTLVTAVSIPLSVIVAIILLDRTGNSLNIMTLGGLTIAIGRVIDDSIVVLENIYRHMAQGEATFPAIINGAREVSIAIVGATATTCAVFLPLGLVGGLIGQLFLSFALAVVFALIASLVVAVTVIPVLARFAIGGRVKVQPEKRAGDTRLARAYTPLLRWALGHRWATLGIAAALFVGSLALLPRLPVQFLPDSSMKTITVNINARPGQTQQAVLDESIQVEKLLPDFHVDRYQSVITGASGDFLAIGSIIAGKGADSATMTVQLQQSGPSKNDTANALRARIASDVPGSDNITVSASGGGFGGGGIQEIVSADSVAAAANLPQAVATVQQTVAGVAATANVKSDLAAAQSTLDIQVDAAKAAAAGLTPQAISTSLANLSSNQTITTANLDGGPRGVRLVLSGADITSKDAIGAFEVARGVRLDAVAQITETPKRTTITRVNGKPAANVTADITGTDTGKVSQNVQKAVTRLQLPAGIKVKTGGVASDINEGFSSMLIAIAVSIALVYGLMALLFQSLLTPFVILFSLPLALIGAIVALVVTGSALSVSSLIGMLMLVGIVVTNAIVLLEFVIMLRHDHGYSTHDALIEGAQTRVRPILMTAIAAMLALVPLELGRSEGALIASDLGRVVIGGLFSSTLLTLVVVPVVYSLVDGLRHRITHRQARTTAAAEPALASPR